MVGFLHIDRYCTLDLTCAYTVLCTGNFTSLWTRSTNSARELIRIQSKPIWAGDDNYLTNPKIQTVSVGCKWEILEYYSFRFMYKIQILGTYQQRGTRKLSALTNECTEWDSMFPRTALHLKLLSNQKPLPFWNLIWKTYLYSNTHWQPLTILGSEEPRNSNNSQLINTDSSERFNDAFTGLNCSAASWNSSESLLLPPPPRGLIICCFFSISVQILFLSSQTFFNSSLI